MLKNGNTNYMKKSIKKKTPKYSIGGDVFSGAASGASAGAMLGPWGMAGGAVVGGLTSFIGSKEKQKQENANNEALKFMQAKSLQTQQLTQNYTSNTSMPTFKKGGIRKYPTGGVKGNAPILNTKQQVIDQTQNRSFFGDGIEAFKKYNLNDPALYENIIDKPNVQASLYNMVNAYGGGQWNDSTARYMANLNAAKFNYGQDPVLGGANSQLTNPRNPATKVQGYGNLTPEQLKNYPQGKYATGGIAQPNAELEKDEIFRTPDGSIQKVFGKTHAQGGEQYNLPEGTEILGQNVDPAVQKEYKQIGDSIKKTFDKYTKVLQNRPTIIAKQTAERMLGKAQDQFTTFMNRQEASKGNEQNAGTFAKGGIQRYDIGGFANGLSSALSPDVVNKLQNQGQGNQFGNFVNQAATYAPMLYNLGQGLFGKAQTLNASQYQNPQQNAAIGLMQNRRYDVSPEIDANQNATANFYQNLRQGAPSQSRYLAGLQTGQIGQQRANADMYSRASNVNNQYKAEEAQMRSGLGEREASTNLTIRDINDKNKAAQNQYLNTGLSQLSQSAQMSKATNNLVNRDKQRINLAGSLYQNFKFDPKTGGWAFSKDGKPASSQDIVNYLTSQNN
jgi:hypothetical protein